MKSRLNRIENWQSEARNSGFDMQRLAERCGVTQRHLRRYFQAARRESLREWLHAARLHEASELLKQGLLVKEVADITGFKRASHFSRVFKLMHGFSPIKAYRPNSKN